MSDEDGWETDGFLLDTTTLDLGCKTKTMVCLRMTPHPSIIARVSDALLHARETETGVSGGRIIDVPPPPPPGKEVGSASPHPRTTRLHVLDFNMNWIGTGPKYFVLKFQTNS